MTVDEVKTMLDFNDSLVVGGVVEIRWTAGGRYYAGRAEIIKLNNRSLRAKLVEPVAPFPVGHEVAAPRFVFAALDRWSENNGVFPVRQ